MPIDLSLIGANIAEVSHTYTWRDVVIYALGVGAKARELDLLYEGAGGPRVLPTFAAVASFGILARTAARLGVNLLRVVHGEQSVHVQRPIPPNATLATTGKVTGIYDKGSGALVVIEGTTCDRGEPVFDTVFSIFVRGAGGFGGERGPKPIASAPAGEPPAFEWVEQTSTEQHLLYRLNGDTNPIHASPELARVAGFERPILHGLCTYGHAARAIVQSLCGGDPARLRSFSSRFTGIVFPGDTLTTRGWQVAPDRYAVSVVTQRGATVIDNSVAIVDA